MFAGGHKTLLAYACIRDAVERRPDVSVVVSVPTLALLDQWVFRLTDDLRQTLLRQPPTQLCIW